MSSSTVVGVSRDHRIAAPADPHAPLVLIASIVILVTNKIYAPFRDVVDPPNITFRDFYA